MVFFMFHPVGGSGLTLKGLCNDLSKKGFECIPIDLPGHGEYSEEDLLYEFDLGVGYLSRKIRKAMIHREEEYCIVGHSMGGIFAYAVEHRLERNYKMQAHSVFVMASSPPDKPAGSLIKNPRRISDRELVNEVSKLGGLPEQILESKSLLKLLCPILRADFCLLSSYIPRKEQSNGIVAPIVVMLGADDQIMHLDEIGDWDKFTESSCKVISFKGNHFFYQTECESVCKEIIRTCMN